MVYWHHGVQGLTSNGCRRYQTLMSTTCRFARYVSMTVLSYSVIKPLRDGAASLPSSGEEWNKICRCIESQRWKWERLGARMEHQNDADCTVSRFRCGLHGQQGWEHYKLDQKLNGISIDYALQRRDFMDRIEHALVTGSSLDGNRILH